MQCDHPSLLSLSLLIAAVIAGCAPSAIRRPDNTVLTSASTRTPTSTLLARESVSSNALLGVPLPSRPDLRLAVFGPHQATYDSTTGGPGEISVDVLITNATDAPANVAGARFGFAVHRDGVEYACNDERPLQSGPSEPVWLGAGAQLAYARTLDCVMPTLGSYGVEVRVRFGPGSFDRKRDLAGELTLSVTGRGAALPRPHPLRKGLEVALVGARTATSIPKEPHASCLRTKTSERHSRLPE